MSALLVGMAVGPMLLLQTDAIGPALLSAVVYGLFFSSSVALN
jgi:hypothetical protein